MSPAGSMALDTHCDAKPHEKGGCAAGDRVTISTRMASRSILLLFCAALRLAAETTVLQHFTLIDGTGRTAIADAAIVITDGRIQYAGPAASAKAPAGAERLNLAGKFVMPGIINLHGHLGNVVDLTQDPKFYTRENVEQ